MKNVIGKIKISINSTLLRRKERRELMHIIDSDKVKYHGLKGFSEEYKKGYYDAMFAPDKTPTIVEDIKNCLHIQQKQ